MTGDPFDRYLDDESGGPMPYGYAYDGPPKKCAPGPRPGTKALRDGVIERFGCGDDGIHNCRTVRVAGSSTLSFHADGRAWDARSTGDQNRRIADWLVVHANELGIQEVISYRRRWDSRTQKWTVYHGDDPHTGHVHAAQCIRAANSLTLATVRAIEGGAPGPINQEDDMAQYDELLTEVRDNIRTLRADVDEIQTRVKEIQATQEREIAKD